MLTKTEIAAIVYIFVWVLVAFFVLIGLSELVRADEGPIHKHPPQHHWDEERIMNDQPKHPFQVGARVAIKSRHNDCYKEEFVAKVHKSGRFTLRADPTGQQWRSWSQSTAGVWNAFPTGQWAVGSCVLWNDAADSMINVANENHDRAELLYEIKRRVYKLRASDITTEKLKAIETILNCED